MFWSRLGLIGLTVLWLAASTARAQTDLPLDPVAPDQTKPTETGLFLEIPSVYGAAKYDQKVNEAPAAVIIITAEQIRKYGYRNFAQILDSAPGLFTNNDRNYGYLGIRGFNRPGDYTSRVLLLIDNHRLNDAVFDQGGSGTEMPIDVDLIDRIEIIKGPGSSLYGTNAFFGVVNVITKRGRDIKGAEVSGEASSFNTYRSRLSYGNKFSNGVEMLVSGSFSDSEGHRELPYPAFASTNNGIAKDADRDNLYYYTGKLSYADFTLTGGHQWRKKNVPTAAFGTVFNDNRQHTLDERTYLDLVYQHEFAYQFNVKARLYYDRYYYKAHLPYDYAGTGTPPFTLNKDVTEADWWGTELTVTKRLFDQHKVTVGTEYRDQFRLNQSNGDLDPPATYLDDKRRSSLIAAYLQDEWAIMNHLVLTAGVRHDHYSTFGGTTNPRAGLISTWDKTTVKLLYGQAFRAPNPYEHPKAHASRPNEKTDAGEGDTSHTPQSPPPAQINRNAWAAIATLQQPGQPNVLHDIIGLYLTSSQTQIDALRQALREQNHDAMMALAHTLKSASATLGAHRLAALANELEEACRTEHGERAEGLIPRIEIEHRDACVIFRTELEPSPKEAA